MNTETQNIAWHGPYGLSTADGEIPLFVEKAELVDDIEDISVQSESDELAEWGGIETDPDFDEDEMDEAMYVTCAQVAQARQQLREAVKEDPNAEHFGVNECNFLPIWQETLGLR